MIKSNSIVKNVQYLLHTYKDHIKSDKQLVLLYWKIIDGVAMNKEVISTKDYLSKTTLESEILDAKTMLTFLRGE